MRMPFALIAIFSLFIAWCSQSFKKVYVFDPPKTWDSTKFSQFLLPLADPSVVVKPISEIYYYSLPEIKIYKSYPIYVNDFDDSLYIDSLKQLEPVEIFKPENILTNDDLIRYGEYVFSAPILTFNLYPGFLKQLRLEVNNSGIPLASRSRYPYYNYIIDQRGKVKVGIFSCAMCHTRVMKDGSVINGAQGSFPMDRRDGYSSELTMASSTPEEQRHLDTLYRRGRKSLHGAPWIKDKSQEELDTMSAKTIIAYLKAIPPGVMARHGSSLRYPVKVPDLIGIGERKYMDATGLMKQTSIGDLMRYSAFNQTLDMLNSYNGFIPSGVDFKTLPEAGKGKFIGTAKRYSDMELFALSNYLYSLVPPKNPERFDPKELKRGNKVFKEEGCADCHKPPLYTNNKLSPVDDFSPSKSDYANLDIFDDFPVGTDPGLALYTRRGTGYYKVPSLKGLWYRGPFGHSGSVPTLEEWFDKGRLENNYVPQGFKPPFQKTMSVPGHQFGLGLSDKDKKALIAFLRSI
jgi:hypothetical protein